MRLICPHCMSGVTVADDAAGKEASCPNCGKSFPTPARYTAAVVPDAAAAVASGAASSAAPPPGLIPPPIPTPVAPAPAAPAGYVPPAPPPSDGFLPPAPPADAPAPAGYAHSVGITVSPKVIAWLPAVLLTAVFALTFFPWVGCYVGNAAVYSQRVWGAAFGASPNRDFRMEQTNTIPSAWLGKLRSDWELMVPFLLALLLAVALAWVERAAGDAPPRQAPPLAKLWPWRNAIVAGLAVLMFLLLLVQVLNGFAMERAIRQQIAEQFAEQRAKVADKPHELARVKYDEEQELDKYNLERTWWLYLALGCTALAVVAVAVRVALDNRGNRPPPKLLLHY